MLSIKGRGLAWAIDSAERGRVPDSVIRAGIRALLAARLRDEAGDCEDQLARRQSFMESMRASPIAPVPEAANNQHYEVPAAFFDIVLGKHRKYSSAYFATPSRDLDLAEADMLRLTTERAGLADGMRILELGCGWGSLTLWMAEHFPQSRIVAVSNSHSQRVSILERCKQRGLSNVEIVTADINHFDPKEKFDRIVSVEMFEHMRNYEALLERIAGWLQPNGQLFVHIFCHRSFAYPFEAGGDDNWMGQHFFTEGIMPSDDLLRSFNRDMEVTQQWRVSGRHYQRTADAWLANLDENWGRARCSLEPVYGDDTERACHRWRIFFMACSELFGYRGGNEWWVSHYLLEPRRSVAASSQRVAPAHPGHAEATRA